MRSLRSRVLASTAAATGIVLLVSGAVVFAWIEKAVWDEFDESLATKARSLAALVEQDEDELELEFAEADLPEYRPSERAEYYQVWSPGETVAARSASLEGRDMARIAGPPAEPAYATVTLPNGRRGRLVGIRFTPRASDKDRESTARHEATLVLGQETEPIEHVLERIRAGMLAVGATAVLVSVGVLAWVVRRGLKPVDRLAGQISAVGETDLGTRIEPAGCPSELAPVVDRLNDLLARLEAAFRRERQFTADVAHELRTPLAGVRSMLEVALSRSRDTDAYRETLRDCLHVSQQMQSMVESLLCLARADARQLEVRKESIDVATLLRECWSVLAGRAAARRLHVSWDLQEPCVLHADAGKLRPVLQNVLNNAVAYANEGGRIDVTAAARDRTVALTVRNTGSKLSPQQVEHVFDRFWRGDIARRGGEEHSGLGLALCKTMVDVLGGSIRAESTREGEFVLSIVMPSKGT